jgi:hypothetical protein
MEREYAAFLDQLTALKPWQSVEQSNACSTTLALLIHDRLSHDFPDVPLSELASFCSYLASILSTEAPTALDSNMFDVSLLVQRKFLDGITYGASKYVQRTTATLSKAQATSDADEEQQQQQQQHHSTTGTDEGAASASDCKLSSASTPNDAPCNAGAPIDQLDVEQNIGFALEYSKLCVLATILIPFRVIAYARDAHTDQQTVQRSTCSALDA